MNVIKFNNLTKYCLQLLILIFLLLITPLIYAQTNAPVIKSYKSNILLQPNGDLSITETINVFTDGNIIKHGIYRDFPTDYQLMEGGTRHIDFKLINTQLDGDYSPNHLADINNGVRIYIGDPHTFLNPGWHTFTLNYLVKYALGFFPDHDELYWNATGNGWLFPIQETNVTLYLPTAIANAITGITGYTGVYGAKGSAFVYNQMPNNIIQFKSTAPLNPGEGLSIVIGWKKGIITPPPLTWKNYLYYVLHYVGNISNIVLGLGAIVIFLYYFWGWLRFGREPAQGNIIPEYEPPAGFSAAALRYMMDMGYDQKVFVAALVNMAIKGYLTIAENSNEFTLTRITLNQGLLTQPEITIANHLFVGGNAVKLSQDNYLLFKDTIAAFKAELRTEFQNQYFQEHSSYVFRGTVFSGVLIFITLWMRYYSFSFNFLWAIILVYIILSFIKQAADTTWRSYIFIILSSFLAMWFFLIMFVGRHSTLNIYDLYYGVILIILALINGIFFGLLKQRTVKGQQLMDHIDGFKMFLAATEKEQLKFINPPTLSPELFDKYLPFAIALNLDENWSKKFSTVLANATQAGQYHQPSWYIGPNTSHFNYANFSSNLSSSLSTAVNAATVGHSSSGSSGFSSGGGFSGGGFGGGGGGGW